MFSGKVPIAIRAKVARMKIKAPIFQSIFSPRNRKKPVAKIKAKVPPIIRPELNRMAVKPSWTPKSLKAFSVQLKLGEEAIASDMHVNATIGVSTPQIPDILSQTPSFSLMAGDSDVK